MSILCIRSILAAAMAVAIVLGLMPQSAPAQQTEAPARSETPDKHDIIVTGPKPDPRCNDADGGAAVSNGPIDYACLNSALKTAAAAANPAPPAADAITSQATTPSKAGTFSHTATAQRMGSNFGHSAQPYRPPAPQYAAPATGARPQ